MIFRFRTLPLALRRAVLATGALTLAMGIWRFWPVSAPQFAGEQPPKPGTATVAGPWLVAVEPGSLLERKFDLTTVRKERIGTPLLTVTGAVMARLRPGKEALADRWQFSSVELSRIYADWEKASTQMDFEAKRLKKTRELTAAQLQSQERVVERLRKLVATGTEAVRDLTQAEAALLQIQLEGQKAVFEAESALTQATHSHADLERQLLQAGVDPALLEHADADSAMVMADVPEVRISLVKPGQACEAHFFGLPGQTFRGTVRSLAPALSPERRTLRVFFELDDSKGQLKPGMYAEIGLGTDPREAVLVPSDGVLHIGDTDFVLTEAGSGLWRVTPVQVGERAGEGVEILAGLTGGERLIGYGAILLKPLVVQALLEARTAPADDGDDP
ncbi:MULTISPECIES: efflux RND transporter periplasmic adaptor subunit [Methylococcus]|uniref:Efflux RND transporter periplasmic adaptor subunit n=1 Tax=Methylococcus capsulatus TaxID=414 RepID=A0ABZ2F955_METCP|nr:MULTISPECIES: efflux RND transporter periplasmic adaptor subunit [Methylococcus]MDF9393583.1 HlyD family efflux transporter periplasmic adaptor subunit [Methylococcus capsulatus]